MFIDADQKEIKRLTIAIVIGLVLTFQSLSILPVIAQSTTADTTTANKLNAENDTPKIHEIKMAGVLLPDGHQAYKMLEYKIIDNQTNTSRIIDDIVVRNMDTFIKSIELVHKFYFDVLQSYYNCITMLKNSKK